MEMLESYKEKIESSKYEYIPIVLGSNINALGIVRSLGENQLPVIVADHENGVAFYSKYACPVKIIDCVLDRDGFINSLHKIASFLESHNRRGILYFSTDAHLFAVGENKSLIENELKIVMNEWDDVKKCIDKSYLYKEAERLNIPYPQTYYAKNSNDMIYATQMLTYPILIKPAITIGFSNIYKKAIIVNGDNELLVVRDEINNLGLSDYELIMQEMIPGSVENLYTFSSYSNKNGDVKAYSIGHKIRQTPPETGTITSGRVIDHHDLGILGISFIKGLRYYGISNTEFKYDSRDGKFKLIEINPRPGLWNYSATAAGVNLSWIAYQNVVLGISEPIKSSDKELIWIYDLMDIIRAVFSNRYGHDKSRISLSRWIRSVRGHRTYAIWHPRDIKPFIKFILDLPRKFISRIR